MAEPRISQIVKVMGGITSYVDLRLELFDDNRNISRMSRYRPITSHREAFKRLARSLNLKDRRVYLVTGSYGTGKSHLALMFANYMQTPANEHPMPEFFDNFRGVDPGLAEELKLKRQTRHYLVALCEWGGKGDFEEVVLNAVAEALKREGFGHDLDTPYLQALKKLDEWRALAGSGGRKGQFYAEFEEELARRNPGTSLDSFKKSLKGFDHGSLEEFKRIHREVTTSRFDYDSEDLVAILTSTLASNAFKERFLGILVLFDEFGDTMERGNLSPKAFQKFAQLCAETPSNCARLIFVGTAHKDLTAYARAYNATDFRTASDRIESIPLTPDGVEDIISAIVVPQKDSALWKEKVVPRSAMFDGFLTDCNRLKLFDWLTGPRIRSRIIENIYPMHPMATYALLQLAQDVASNNRSVYTFFSGDISEDSEPDSYGHYVATTPIEASGKLNLYTADRLWGFFQATLKSDNKELRDTVREQIKDYETSLRELNRVTAQDQTARMQLEGDLLILRIMRLMLIYNIVQIPATKENLQFGLYLTSQLEATELQNRLQTLTKKGILYLVKETGVYEFKQSTSVDLDRMVEDYKRNDDNQPGNIVAELTELVPFDKKGEQYVEAKDYNLPFGEDKRLERRLTRPVDLTSEVDTPLGRRTYFQVLDAEVEQETAKRGEFEGIALYVVCETQDDIQKARDACARNESQRVVVAVPRQPVPMLDAVLELRALISIEQAADTMNLSMQDRAMLRDRLNGDSTRQGAKDVLRARRDKLFNPREITWYGQYAQPVPTDNTRAHDAANRVMELLYSQFRNQFAHDDFNKLRARDLTKNQGLREAVEELIHFTEPITIDTSFAQARGDIRYLQKCLLNNGALDQEGKAEGAKLRCKPAISPERYESKLPTLAIMVAEVQNLGAGDKLKIRDWVTRYRKPPYGQGPVALAISFAFLLRVLGDSVRIKREEGAVGDMTINDFEAVLALIDGQYPNAFLSYRQLRPEEKALINHVYALFGAPDSAVTRDYTIVEAHSAMQQWWKELPPLARVSSLYAKSGRPSTADFIGAMQKIEARDAYSFLFDELPSAYGADAGTIITQELVAQLNKELPVDKQSIEAAVSSVEDRIVAAVRTMFGVTGTTYEDVLDRIREWYNALDALQKDIHATWQDNNSRPLIAHLKTMSSLQDTFMVKIPSSSDYGMKPVADWISDRTNEYVSRLQRGKALIDEHRLKVEVPAIHTDTGSDGALQDGGTVKFRDTVHLAFEHPKPGTRVFVTEGAADPTDSNAPRQEVNGSASLVIQDNKTLRVAAQDADGNWSQVVTVQLINEHDQYMVKLPKQKGLPGYGDTVTFVFPPDAQSFEATCRSLFSLSVERGLLTNEQLAARLREIADQLAGGK